MSGESVFRTSFLIGTSGYGRFFQIRLEYTLTKKNNNNTNQIPIELRSRC